MTVTTPAHRGAARGGPPLTLVASVFAALFVASLVAGSALAGGTFPSPFDHDSVIQAYFAGHRDAVRVGAVLQFGAAVPLAIFAAAVHARLHQLGIRVAGATIALAGGLLASGFATLSALLQWTLSRPAATDQPALVSALHDLAFLTGGPAQVVAFGLLLAGIAVPALIVGLLPRWVAVAGLVLAAAAELSTLVLISPGFGLLLPLARFGGMAWLIVAGAKLPFTLTPRAAHRPDRLGRSATAWTRVAGAGACPPGAPRGSRRPRRRR